jgi:hypothetical protein
MTNATPIIETMIPHKFNWEIRSLKKYAVTKGLNRGIVEMITAERVDETSFTPKLSHKKYRKG